MRITAWIGMAGVAAMTASASAQPVDGARFTAKLIGDGDTRLTCVFELGSGDSRGESAEPASAGHIETLTVENVVGGRCG